MIGLLAIAACGAPAPSQTTPPPPTAPASIRYALSVTRNQVDLEQRGVTCDGEVVGKIAVARSGTGTVEELPIRAPTFEQHCIAGLPYDRAGHGGGTSCDRMPLSTIEATPLALRRGELELSARLVVECGQVQVPVVVDPIRVASDGVEAIVLAVGQPNPFVAAAPPPTPPPPPPPPPPSPPDSPPPPEVVDQAPRPTTGIYGKIGVQHAAIQHSPVADHPVTIRGARGAKVVRTDRAGRYSAELAPGDYTVEIARPAGYQNLAGDTRARVRVVAGKAVELDFGFSDGTRCLDAATAIATPTGPRPIAELAIGDPIWVCGDDGVPRPDVVIATSRSTAPGRARRLELDDGRVLVVAPHHPLADGTLPGALRPGARLAGGALRAVAEVRYSTGASHDLVTAGGRPYYASGIALRSTLAATPAVRCQPLTAPAVNPPTR